MACPLMTQSGHCQTPCFCNIPHADHKKDNQQIVWLCADDGAARTPFDCERSFANQPTRRAAEASSLAARDFAGEMDGDLF